MTKSVNYTASVGSPRPGSQDRRRRRSLGRFVPVLSAVLLLTPLSLLTAQDSAFDATLSSAADVSTSQALKPAAYLVPADVSFAHIAVGGTWRTSFFLVNMGSKAIPYTLRFYNDSGLPMTLPIGGDLISVFNGTLQPNGENNFTATNSDPVNVKQGQAVLTYDHSLGQIGGYSVFQSVVPNKPTYEATVPLSGSDYKLYLPYYHFDGYFSGVALANPSSTVGTTVTILGLDNLGVQLTSDTIYLAPLGHISFLVTDRYAFLDNHRGNLYITSSSGLLSAVGLRFSPGGSYTTIPIMNWTGMFP
jgi:hypothetical protein